MNPNAISPRFQTLSMAQGRAWMLAAAFVAGNIALPQLCHALLPQGGLIFLPIYFFTLFGAYKYGWQVGLLTALASPVLNCLLFGMPALAMVPIIIIKGALLATAAGYAARRFGRASLPLLAAIVAFYQIAGGCVEAVLAGSVAPALQDLRLGLPGLLIQIFIPWLVLERPWRNAKNSK